MQQVVVRKQGRMDYCSWSSRVLTLDPAAGVLLLSKKGNADRIAYHAMQPMCIEVWPYYNSKYVEEGFDSLPAKLTLRLAGCAFPRPQSKRGRRVLNSAGMDFDEAWVLRFTSLQQLCSAVMALEQLTHQQSRDTSDGSFGEQLKTDVCAVLPGTAEQLLRPIRAAWDIECVKTEEKARRARILESTGKDPLEMYR